MTDKSPTTCALGCIREISKHAKKNNMYFIKTSIYYYSKNDTWTDDISVLAGGNFRDILIACDESNKPYSEAIPLNKKVHLLYEGLRPKISSTRSKTPIISFNGFIIDAWNKE